MLVVTLQHTMEMFDKKDLKNTEVANIVKTILVSFLKLLATTVKGVTEKPNPSKVKFNTI